MSAEPTYKFTGPDGKPVEITGQSAMKAYLAEGGLEHLLPNGEPRSEPPADDEPGPGEE